MMGRLPVLARASLKIRSRFGVRRAEIQPANWIMVAAKTKHERERANSRVDCRGW